MKHVVFDVDGVLVHPWRFRAWLEREHGIDPETTRPFFEGPLRACIVGEADLFDEIAPFLGPWGWQGSVESFVGVWFEVENAPDLEVLELATDLRSRGIPCHVASNQERHRAYLRAIEERLGQAPGGLVLVDDTGANEEAAKHRGWEGLFYTGPTGLAGVRRRLLEVADDSMTAR